MDLADLYEVNETKDGAIISHRLGADCTDYSTSELIELFARNEIPIASANRRSEVIDDPQVKASGTLQEIQHPRGGAIIQPRTPVQFEKTPATHRMTSAEVGQHTVEVLSELGITMDEMQAMARNGAIG